MTLSVAMSELLLRGSISSIHGNTARAMAQYYSFPAAPATPPTIALISLGGSYKMSDLIAYWRLQGLSGTPKVRYVSVGGSLSRPEQTKLEGDGSDENTLDLEIATSMCPTAQCIVYFGQNTYDGFYQAVAAAINGPAKIISISWGGPEDSFKDRKGIEAFDLLFQQAQNLGKVVCAATGDNGSSDGTAHLVTNYPSCSPFVIACGGTTLLADGQEVGWSWNPAKHWGTGGGVSNYFPPPVYQRGVVGPYTGRATPDLALLADPETGWTIYSNGKLEVNQWGGTSAVAPAMSALLACYNLNSYASLHQQMYSISKTLAFRDVLTGSNDSLTSTKKSYSAKKGYDLVTGWGSVHGLYLRNALLVKKVPLKPTVAK
jgi:kumamolisin